MFITRHQNASGNIPSQPKVIFRFKRMYSCTPGPVKESPCTSDLTYFRQAFSVAQIEQKSPPSKRTTRPSVQLKESTHDHGVSSSGFIAKAGLAIGKKSTFFSSTDTYRKWTVSDFCQKFLQKKHALYTCAPIQYTLLSRYINGSVCKASARPPRE